MDGAMIDWLRLIRASGLATIVSNLIAAVIVCDAGDSLKLNGLFARLDHGGARVLWIPVASFLLYASGMLWNDINDIDRDRVLNPRRPLPSGRIGLASAYVVGVVMAVGALLAGFMAEGRTGFCAAGVVLTLALLYDFAAKEVRYLGSLVMALTRASHAVFALLLLGSDYLKVALLGGDDPGRQPWLLSYPLILGVYVLGLTLISELESRHGRRWELLVGGALLGSAIALAAARVASAHWITSLYRAGGAGPVAVTAAIILAIIVLAALLVILSRPYLEMLRSGRQALVGATVRTGLGCMILLDAVVASSAHPLGALPILLLYPLFRAVGAFIRMD
jgi:4-hydroxybenzoate polyprenyltransferase